MIKYNLPTFTSLSVDVFVLASLQCILSILFCHPRYCLLKNCSFIVADISGACVSWPQISSGNILTSSKHYLLLNIRKAINVEYICYIVS